MKASDVTIKIATERGKAAKNAGLTSICQDSQFLDMLIRFDGSVKDLIAAFSKGFNS